MDRKNRYHGAAFRNRETSPYYVYLKRRRQKELLIFCDFETTRDEDKLIKDMGAVVNDKKRQEKITFSKNIPLDGCRKFFFKDALTHFTTWIDDNVDRLSQRDRVDYNPGKLFMKLVARLFSSSICHSIGCP